jgi:hypothetical protein
MGNEDEASLLAKDSALQFSFSDITYSSLKRMLLPFILVDVVLFSLLLFEGIDNYYGPSILIAWIFVSVPVGYLTVLTCAAGIEEILKGKYDAPSWPKMLFLGAFTVVLFSIWLYMVKMVFFMGF